MKIMRDEWNQMDARQKAPYESEAVADTNRYVRQVSYRVHRYKNVFIYVTLFTFSTFLKKFADAFYFSKRQRCMQVAY